MRTFLGADLREELDKLIPIYAQNKLELDSYKKICDTQNAKIKEMLNTEQTQEYTTGGYTAKRIVTERVTLDEERLIGVLKVFLMKRDLDEIVKTKEYIDMDALEKYLYNNGTLTHDFATELDKCKTTTEIVQLRLSKKKKKKEEEE